MSPKVMELKSQIYDQVVINTNSQRQIAALEQQLLAELKKEAKDATVVSEAPEVVHHNNT